MKSELYVLRTPWSFMEVQVWIEAMWVIGQSLAVRIITMFCLSIDVVLSTYSAHWISADFTCEGLSWNSSLTFEITETISKITM